MDLGGPARLRLILLPSVICRGMEEFPISPCSCLVDTSVVYHCGIFGSSSVVIVLWQSEEELDRQLFR